MSACYGPESWQEQQKHLEIAQKLAHVGSWEWDILSGRQIWSAERYAIFGVTPGEIIPSYDVSMRFIHPEDREKVAGRLAAAISGETPFDTEYRIVRRDGSVRYLHSVGIIEFAADGKPVRMLGIGQDITEHKLAEEALEKYWLFSDNARDIVLFVRRDGRILEANTAASRAYGYTREELLATSIYDLRAGDQDEQVENQMERAYRQGILFEALHRRKDGSTFPVEVSSQGRLINGQEVLLSVIRDITERKQIETRLRLSELRYRTLFENMLEGYAYCQMIYDENGKPADFVYLKVNGAFEKLTGLKDVAGKRLTELIPEVRTAHPEIFEIYGRVALTGKPEKFVIEFKPLASWFSISVYSNEKEYFTTIFENITPRIKAEEALQHSKAELEKANAALQIKHEELELQSEELESQLEELQVNNEELDQQISERKRAEKQMAVALKEKEILLKEIHHRVKNNMQIISSLLNLQLSYLDQGNSAALRECQNRIKSMALIHEKLYQAGDLSHIDFAEYIRSLTTSLIRSYQIDTRVNIVIDIDKVALDMDTAIPCGLIINELVSNSLKYAFTDSPSGTIFIHIASAGGACTLTVGDNGAGLPPGTDFKNTSSLGLQLVNILADQIGGTIELKDEPGTIFTVTFKEKAASQV